MESEGRALTWNVPTIYGGCALSWQGDQGVKRGGWIEPQALAGNICHDLTVMPEDI